MILELGLTARKLHEQLGCEPAKVEQLQNDLDAINRLMMRGVLSHSEVRKAEKRVIKKLSGVFA